ncbi:hypothetical protein GGF31_001394 [Allomyces arbusculus]|nr:hypothetical protein GGF31_001394 [Allomyces arbusculus]
MAGLLRLGLAIRSRKNSARPAAAPAAAPGPAVQLNGDPPTGAPGPASCLDVPAATRPRLASASSFCADPHAEAVAQLLNLFPDADPMYLAKCVGHYEDHPANVVERIAHKIVDLNHGYYPSVVPPTAAFVPPTVATTPTPSPPASSSSSPSTSRGSGRARTDSLNPLDTEDQTATRNLHLQLLAELFPDADLAHLRSLIVEYPSNTVLRVTKRLLSENGRYPRRKRWGQVLASDLFRGPRYIRGATDRLLNAFPKHWKSSIRAYLAEHNFDYVSAYTFLRDQPAPSTFFLFNLFARRPIDSQEMYDPDLLRDVDRLQLSAATTTTPLDPTADDEHVARQLNLDEYMQVGDLLTCACCWNDLAWEDMVACCAGHLFCTACLARVVQEAVFGQQAAALVTDGPAADGVACFHSDGCTATFDDASVARAVAAYERDQRRERAATSAAEAQQPAAVEPVVLVTGGSMLAANVHDPDPAVNDTFLRFTYLRAKRHAIAAGFVVDTCQFCPYFEVRDAPRPHRALWCLLLGGHNDTSAPAALARRFVAHWLNPALVFTISPTAARDAVPACCFGGGDADDVDDNGRFDPVAARLHAWFPTASQRRALGQTVALMQVLWSALLVRILLMPVVAWWPAHMIAAGAELAAYVHLARWSMAVVDEYVRGPVVGPAAAAADARNDDEQVPALDDEDVVGMVETNDTKAGLAMVQLPSRVRVLRCRNVRCLRATCLQCRSEYLPHHRCGETSEDSVVHAVEQAMSNAIKRVCPKCALPFTKSDGCNLMKCSCGYVMCYVCRKGIRDEKYQHFCQHFRLVAGKCQECDRCELYATEDEAKVRRAAGRRALDEWRVMHPHERIPDAVLKSAMAVIER